MNIYTYICNHENNVPSRLSPQWLCGNSCTWAHDVRLYIYIYYIYIDITLYYIILYYIILYYIILYYIYILYIYIYIDR